jgi:hypothetical protein
MQAHFIPFGWSEAVYQIEMSWIGIAIVLPF